MKTLALKSAFLLIPFILMFVYCETNLRQIPNSYNIKKKLLEEKLPDIKILIMGSSHAYEGIVPSILDQNAFNLSNTSQSLYYDSKLIGKYIDQMKSLRLVILSIDFFSLQYQLYDSLEYWRSFFYYFYFGIPNDLPSRSSDLRNFSVFAMYEPRKSLSYVFNNFKVDLCGGSIDSNGTLLISKDEKISKYKLSETEGERTARRHYESMRSKHVSENMKILDALLKELKKRDIAVVLITLPAFHTYTDYVVKLPQYADMQKTIFQLYKSNNIQYFNYLLDPRFKEEDFSDSDHLNYSGAEKFSRIILDDFVLKYTN